MLDLNGFGVSTATDGAEAIRTLSVDRPDAVILDVLMPGLDGLEVCRRMRAINEPDDFVVSTGETHSVRELCEIAFAHVGLDWHEHVVVDDKYLRPAEVDLLVGDATKAKTVLKWEKTVSFADLVAMMVDADVEVLRVQNR